MGRITAAVLVAAIALIIAMTWTPTVEATSTTTESSVYKSSVYEKSCLWYRGKRKWCLVEGWYTDERTIEVREGRVYVYNQKDEVLGYMRSTGPGRWRAMWLSWKGWVRGGRAVRVTRSTYHVFEAGKRRGIARGPAAIAVVALKLVSGDCYTDGPNQTTCIA